MPRETIASVQRAWADDNARWRQMVVEKDELIAGMKAKLADRDARIDGLQKDAVLYADSMLKARSEIDRLRGDLTAASKVIATLGERPER